MATKWQRIRNNLIASAVLAVLVFIAFDLGLYTVSFGLAVLIMMSGIRVEYLTRSEDDDNENY